MLIVVFLSNAQIGYYIFQYAPWACSTHRIRCRSDVASVDFHNAPLSTGSNAVQVHICGTREDETLWDTSGKQCILTNFLRVGHWNVYIKRISGFLFFNLQKRAKQQTNNQRQVHFYTFILSLWAMLMLTLTPQKEAVFQHEVELKEPEQSQRTSSKEECVNMSPCVRPMRGVMTEVGGVMGVMAGDGPSDSRMSLSGLSSETSSVASVEGQRETFSGRKSNFPA